MDGIFRLPRLTVNAGLGTSLAGLLAARDSLSSKFCGGEAGSVARNAGWGRMPKEVTYDAVI